MVTTQVELAPRRSLLSKLTLGLGLAALGGALLLTGARDTPGISTGLLHSSAGTWAPWQIRPTSASTQCTGEEFIVAWVRPERRADGRPKLVGIDFYLRNAQPGQRWSYGTMVRYEMGDVGVIQNGDGAITVPASGGGRITGVGVPPHARTLADITVTQQSDLPYGPSMSECQIGVKFKY